ncbi:MAG: aminotransferase [Clostridiaceae bacterium]|nr:aminotransferase [Clostridiaceae bacterium]
MKQMDSEKQPSRATQPVKPAERPDAGTKTNEETRPDETTVLIRLGPAGRRPLYATSGSAGCDLFSADSLILRPGETRLLPLDLVMALEPGVEAQIRPRSGLSLRTALRLPNTPGTIDSDYRSEVCVLLQNTFNQADLLLQMAVNPQILIDLVTNGRRTTLAEYWQSQGIDPEMPGSGTDQIRMSREIALWRSQALYLDEQGNPYGTLYFQPGERIAQMVFSRCLKARFADHPSPETVGVDRGGGFGSTGSH